MIYIKEHSGKVLAACDEELLGKTLKSKDKELKVTSKFYEGQKVTEQEFIKLLKTHNNINLIGNKVVEIAEKQGIIKHHSEINNTKYAVIITI